MDNSSQRRSRIAAAGRRGLILARSRGTVVVAALLLFGLQACSTPVRLPPVPRAETSNALPLGLQNVRYFADEDAEEMAQEGLRSVQREVAAMGGLPANGRLPTANFLAISGGGDNGAFGAGLLVGWTKAGNRPSFKVVTGISTGSLIAPLAFLGPAYDATLQQVYTTISQKDIFVDRGLTAAIFDDALSDTSPLFAMISSQINEQLLAEIASEYAKGRLLLIGTTNLDAQRPVIWNMGALAASGHPRRLELFRRILLASAAVPAAFPPVLIDVEVPGKPDTKYQELHVDGGAIAQVFLYPPSIRLDRESARMRQQGISRERRAFIIRNGRVDPEWNEVERSTLTIAGRAISTMIHVSGLNDLFRVWTTAQRDGVDYNLAYIGSDFEAPRKGDFDREFMSALFAYAHDRAVRGYPWHKTPPFMNIGR
ncbi:MAG: patatin-like phospholipase family protein [Alphaproteobacteria bacterium]